MNARNSWSSVAELWHCSDLICDPPQQRILSTSLKVDSQT